MDDLGPGHGSRSQGTSARPTLGGPRPGASCRVDYGSEAAQSNEEALTRSTVPGPWQNFVVVDDKGRIGWTIYGSMARCRLRRSSSRVVGRRHTRWSGWLNPNEHLACAGIASGGSDRQRPCRRRRHADSDWRWQLRDRIACSHHPRASRHAGPLHTADLLNIQLDTSAEFLSRWRTLLLQSLKTVTDQPRIRLREIVEGDWTDASPGSAGYRLTRMFREEVSEAIIAFVLTECNAADPTFDYRNVRRREGPIWKLVSESRCTLDPRYPSWDALLLNAATNVVVRAERGRTRRAVVTNITAYRHPLSAGLPFVGRWLDMPCSRCLAISTPQHALERVGLVGADDRLPVTRAKGSCTCQQARAATHSRRSTRTHIRHGSMANRRHFCRTNGLYVDAHAVNLRLKIYDL